MSVPVLRRVQDGYTYAGEANLAVLTCPTCGVTYAIPERLRAQAYEWGERKLTWYCPNGHNIGFNGESAEARAKRDAKREGDRAARLQALLDQTQSSLRAAKGRGTRFKNDRDRERRRAAHGVCPCCGRTFKQLVRHMASQHPEFIDEQDQIAGQGE